MSLTATSHQEKSDDTLSIVIPTRNSSRFIAKTLSELVELGREVAVLEVIVVDDFSDDSSRQSIQDWMRTNPSLEVRLVSTRIRVGQHLATAFGLQLAFGARVLVIDDDIPISTTELLKFMRELKHDQDFSMAGFASASNSLLRRVASELARRLAQSMFQLPSATRFSSLILFRGEFIRGVFQSGEKMDYPLWMFRYSHRFSNPTVSSINRDWRPSNYSLRALFRAAQPVLGQMYYLMLRASTFGAAVIALTSLSVGGYVLVRALFGDGLLSGFPTLAILAAANLTISILTLSLGLSVSRSALTAKTQNVSVMTVQNVATHKPLSK